MQSLESTKWNTHSMWRLCSYRIASKDQPADMCAPAPIGYPPNAHIQVNYATLPPPPTSPSGSHYIICAYICVVAWKPVLFAHLINYFSRNCLCYLVLSYVSVSRGPLSFSLPSCLILSVVMVVVVPSFSRLWWNEILTSEHRFDKS